MAENKNRVPRLLQNVAIVIVTLAVIGGILSFWARIITPLIKHLYD